MNFLIGLLPILGSVFGFYIPPALLKILPTLIALAPQIQDAVRIGKPALDEILKVSPELLPVLQRIGATLFPDVAGNLTSQAGAQAVFDPVSIKVAQTALNTLGQAPPLEVDGIPGSLTKAAVFSFQAANPPLVVDGWPGPKTNAVLVAKVAALT